MLLFIFSVRLSTIYCSVYGVNTDGRYCYRESRVQLYPLDDVMRSTTDTDVNCTVIEVLL